MNAGMVTPSSLLKRGLVPAQRLEEDCKDGQDIRDREVMSSLNMLRNFVTLAGDKLTVICNRLEPVLNVRPVDEEGAKNPESPVPLARQINVIGSEVSRICKVMDLILRDLEI